MDYLWHRVCVLCPAHGGTGVCVRRDVRFPLPLTPLSQALSLIKGSDGGAGAAEEEYPDPPSHASVSLLVKGEGAGAPCLLACATASLPVRVCTHATKRRASPASGGTAVYAT